MMVSQVTAAASPRNIPLVIVAISSMILLLAIVILVIVALMFVWIVGIVGMLLLTVGIIIMALRMARHAEGILL